MSTTRPTDERVASHRGAPMGRSTFTTGLYATPAGESHTVTLYRVRLDSGGYDKGGAYWGVPDNLYCAYSDGFQAFARAENAAQAAEKIKHEFRAVGSLNIKIDRRSYRK